MSCRHNKLEIWCLLMNVRSQFVHLPCFLQWQKVSKDLTMDNFSVSIVNDHLHISRVDTKKLENELVSTLRKVSESWIPALTSKMEDLESPMKSDETTISSVMPRMPFIGPSAASRIFSTMSSYLAGLEMNFSWVTVVKSRGMITKVEHKLSTSHCVFFCFPLTNNKIFQLAEIKSCQV